MRPHPTPQVFCALILIALSGAGCRAARSEASAHRYVRSRYVDPTHAGKATATRIHGGFEAPEGKFRYMVFLLISRTRDLRDPTMTCSASLIHEKWVLTAAHCIKPRSQPPSIIAVGGKANLRDYYRKRISLPFEEPVDERRLGVQERRAIAVHVNPEYNEQSNYNDLALLELDKPFRLGGSIETIALSEEKSTGQMSCSVAGWGLSELQVQTFALMFVQDVYAQTTEMSCSYKKSGPLLCLEEGGPGICKGDSGSPLVCNGTSWGVASFSLSVSRDPKCGNYQEEYYAEVYPHLTWLQGTMSGGNKENVVDGSSGATLFGAGLRLLLLRVFAVHFLR